MAAVPPPAGPPVDPQVELARDRNRLAADRTLLSFVRTDLTLIGIGLGLEQILSALSPENRPIDAWAYGLSLGFVGLGVASLGIAIADYRAELRRLRTPAYRYIPRPSLGELTGVGVMVAGAIALSWLGFTLRG